MKKRLVVGFTLFVLLLSLLCACTKIEPSHNLWENALYTNDAGFGNGEKTVTITVTAKEKSVVFTIKTDKEILGDALIEHRLIEGEKGAYGLYVKKVNGIRADYDLDKSYWSLTKNGEYMSSGVDGVKINDGEKYEFTYIKE